MACCTVLHGRFPARAIMLLPFTIPIPFFGLHPKIRNSHNCRCSPYLKLLMGRRDSVSCLPDMATSKQNRPVLRASEPQASIAAHRKSSVNESGSLIPFNL